MTTSSVNLHLTAASTGTTVSSVDSMQTDPDFTRALTQSQLGKVVKNSALAERTETYLVSQKGPQSSHNTYEPQMKVLEALLTPSVFARLKAHRRTALAALMAHKEDSIEDIAGRLYKGKSAVQKFISTLQDAAKIIDPTLNKATQNNFDNMRFYVELLESAHDEIPAHDYKRVHGLIDQKLQELIGAYDYVWDVDQMYFSYQPLGGDAIEGAEAEITLHRGVALDALLEPALREVLSDTNLEAAFLVFNKEFGAAAKPKPGLDHRNPQELKRYGQIVVQMLEEQEIPKNFFESKGLDLTDAMNELAKMYTQGMGNLTYSQRALLMVMGRGDRTLKDTANLDVIKEAEQHLVKAWSGIHPDWVNKSQYFKSSESEVDTTVTLNRSIQKVNDAVARAVQAEGLTTQVLGLVNRGSNMLDQNDPEAAGVELQKAQSKLLQVAPIMEEVKSEIGDSDVEEFLMRHDASWVKEVLLQAKSSISIVEGKVSEAQKGVSQLNNRLDAHQAGQDSQHLLEQVLGHTGSAKMDLASANELQAQAQQMHSQGELEPALDTLSLAEPFLLEAAAEMRQAKTDAESISRLAQQHSNVETRAEEAKNTTQEVGNSLDQAQSALQSLRQNIESTLGQAQVELRQAQAREQEIGDADFTLSLMLKMPETLGEDQQYSDLAPRVRELLLDMWLAPDTRIEDLLESYPDIDEGQLNVIASAQGIGIESAEGLRRYVTSLRAVEQDEASAKLLKNHLPQGWAVPRSEEALVEILSNPASNSKQSERLLRSLAGGHTEGLGVWRLLSAIEPANPALADGFRLSDLEMSSLPTQVAESVEQMASVANTRLIWLLNNYSVPELQDMGFSDYQLQSAVGELNLEALDTPAKLHQYLQRHQQNTTPAPSADYFQVGSMEKVPIINTTKLISTMKAAGFSVQKSATGKVRGKGNHIRFERIDPQGDKIVIGFQSLTKDISLSTMKRILFDARITAEQFIQLLNGHVPESLWSDSNGTAEAGQRLGLKPQQPGSEGPKGTDETTGRIQAGGNQTGNEPGSFGFSAWPELTGLIDPQTQTQTEHDGSGNNGGNRPTAVADEPEEPQGLFQVVNGQVNVAGLSFAELDLLPGRLQPGENILGIPVGLPKSSDSAPTENTVVSIIPPEAIHNSDNVQTVGKLIGGKLGSPAEAERARSEMEQLLGKGSSQGVRRDLPATPFPKMAHPGGIGQDLPRPTVDEYNTGWGLPESPIDVKPQPGFPEKDPLIEALLNPKGPGGPQFEFPAGQEGDEADLPASQSSANAMEAAELIKWTKMQIPAFKQMSYGQFSQLSKSDQQQLVQHAVEYENLSPDVKGETSLYQYADSRQTSATQREQLQRQQHINIHQASQLNVKKLQIQQTNNQIKLIEASIRSLQTQIRQIEQQSNTIEQSNTLRQTIGPATKRAPAIPLPMTQEPVAVPGAAAIKTKVNPAPAAIPRFMVVPTDKGPRLVENFPGKVSQMLPFPIPPDTPLTRQQGSTWSNVPDTQAIVGKTLLDVLFSYGAVKMLNNGNAVKLPDAGSQARPTDLQPAF